MNDEIDDLLVLTGEAGITYAIPRAALEQYRVTGEDLAAVQQALGEDVAGFQMQHPFVTGHQAQQHHAALLEEAARERAARGQDADADADDEIAAVHPTLIATFVRRARLAGARRTGGQPAV